MLKSAVVIMILSFSAEFYDTEDSMNVLHLLSGVEGNMKPNTIRRPPAQSWRSMITSFRANR